VKYAPYCLTIAMLLATLAASQLSDQRIPESLAAPLDSIAGQLAGWQADKEHELDSRALSRLQPTSYLARTYRKNNRSLELFVAYYAAQRAGENMHSPRHCLPGSGWEIWRNGTAELQTGHGPETVNHYLVHKADERMVILYWYQSSDRMIASEYLGKALLVRDALISGRTAGSLVRIAVPDEPGASEAGVQFATALIPEMERCLGAGGSRSR
jgi:EpsI family protein